MIEELREQLKEQRERDTIKEVRSARDKALQQVKDLLEFREGVANALELSNPDLVEPDDISNKICELEDDIDDERTTCGPLKVFAMKVHNQVYGTNYDDEDISTSFDYDCIIGKMIDDEDELHKIRHSVEDKLEELKAERDKYFGYLKDKDLECETQREQKEKAYEEINKLKKVIKETKRAMGHSVSDTEEEEEEQ
jgi:uncharacterized coiled-coil DUF342 family protein